MARTRVTLTVNLDRKVANTRGVRRELQAKVDRAADESRQIARSEAYDTGDYHDSISGDVEDTRDGPRGTVTAADWKAGLIEYGYMRAGRFYPPKAILRRGADAADLTVKETR